MHKEERFIRDILAEKGEMLPSEIHQAAAEADEELSETMIYAELNRLVNRRDVEIVSRARVRLADAE